MNVFTSPIVQKATKMTWSTIDSQYLTFRQSERVHYYGQGIVRTYLCPILGGYVARMDGEPRQVGYGPNRLNAIADLQEHLTADSRLSTLAEEIAKLKA